MDGSARRAVLRGGAAAGVLALTAAGSLLVAPTSSASAGLTSFEDCSTFGRWARDTLAPGVTDWGWTPYGAGTYGGGVVASMAAGAAGAAGAEDSAASSAVGAGAGGLNTQEVGVGEPAAALAQDGLLVTVHDDELLVLDTSEATPTRLGGTAMPAAASTPDDAGYRQPSTLLLTGEADGLRAVVFTPRWSNDTAGHGSVVATVADLSDPARPTVLGHQEFVGDYLDARVSDGVVRMVMTTGPVLPWVQPTDDDSSSTGSYDAGDADAFQARHQQGVASNQALLANAADADLLPQLVVRGEDGAVESFTPALGCSAIAHPDVPSGGGIVTISSIEPSAVTSDADVVADAVGITAATDLVYAAQDRLYLATTAGSGVMPVDVMIDRSIDTATGTSGDSASSMMAPTGADTTTQLHGFALDGTRTTHVATGEVDGRVLGRWAFSARDGFLRVATTTGERWAPDGGVPDSSSQLTVLAERAGRLEQVGQVAGLGAGEQIQAVRYDGDRAYVVTFRRTDPLYVLDLADPTAPRAAGELKVDGYSAYLHPIGEGRLIGVGQDADPATGQVRGVQVAAIDVNDPAAPRQTGVLVVPGSSSAVEWDARAFSYDPSAATALLPVDDGQTGTSSLRSLTVDAQGLLVPLAERRLTPQTPNGTVWSSLEQIVSVGDGRVAVVVSTQDYSDPQNPRDGREVRLLDTRTLQGGDPLQLQSAV